MRAARLGDHMRRLLRREAAAYWVASVELSEHPRMGTGVLDLMPSVTAVTGVNGVGKTTLIRMLAVALRATRPTGEGLAGVSVVGLRKVMAMAGKAEIDPSGNVPGAVTLIEPGADTLRLVARTVDDAEFASALSGHEAREYSHDELTVVKQMVGREYSKVRVFEVEYDDIPTMPHFEVSDRHGTYGSQDMGSGELSCIYLHWAISRVPERSILLIEEPEAFMSPRSQTESFKQLIRIAEERKHCVVMSTHSASFLSALPLQNIRILLPRSNRSDHRLGFAPTKRELLLDVGGQSGRRPVVVFVEDVTAAAMVRAIVECFDTSELAPELDVVPCGSHSNVASRLSMMIESPIRALDVVGLMDGDQRQTYALLAQSAPLGFLPGNAPPEALLREWAAQNVQDFADASRCSVLDVNAALAATEGLDVHEWIGACATVLRCDSATMVDAMCRGWARSLGGDTLKPVLELLACE